MSEHSPSHVDRDALLGRKAPTRKDLVFGMAGSGGDGIVSAGESLLLAAAAEGYHGVMTKSFGSQIRGGESSCRVRISTDPVLNPGGNLDVAVALNWDDFLKFGQELPVSGNTVVIYEGALHGWVPADTPVHNPAAAERHWTALFDLLDRNLKG